MSSGVVKMSDLHLTVSTDTRRQSAVGGKKNEANKSEDVQQKAMLIVFLHIRGIAHREYVESQRPDSD